MSNGSSGPKFWTFRCQECGQGFRGCGPGLCRFCKRKKDEEREAFNALMLKKFEEKYYPTEGMKKRDGKP